jgi:hypothetical protein
MTVGYLADRLAYWVTVLWLIAGLIGAIGYGLTR